MPSAAAHANRSSPPSDRRLHLRQTIRSIAYVEIDDGNGGIVLNISEGGVSVQAVMNLMEDISPRLRFQLAQSRDWIETSARIAWTNESRKVAGLQFVDLPAPTRTRLREWLSSETSPGTVVEAPHEDSAPSGPSQRPLPPTASPDPAPPTVESLLLPLPAAQERRQDAPIVSEIAAVPLAITAPPAAPAPPAPVHMFGQTFNEVYDSGGRPPESSSHPAENSHRMWILAGLLLCLAVVSTAAGWVAGQGTFGKFLSGIWGGTLGSKGQQENGMSPSLHQAAAVSEIEILDADNQRWVIPFVAPGGGIEETPHGQKPVNATKPVPDRPTVEASASSPVPHASPAAGNATPDGKNQPVASAPPSEPGNASPASGSTQSRSRVSPPQPAPSIAGVLQPGEIVSRTDPTYPESAQEAGIEGTVKLRVMIGTDGAVRSMAVISGPGPLVEAAEAAVGQWRYTPTLLDGKPVEAEDDVSVVFQLPSAAKSTQ
jgi:protein TonB